MLFSDLYYSALAKIKDENKAIDIQVLIEKSFGLSKTHFWIKKSDKISNRTNLKRFYRNFQRLLKHEPLAYILKEKEFYSNKFYVNKNVLIPRPETEILIDQALRYLALKDQALVLDIGAGCGNIAITLAQKTGSRVIAVEKSKKAMYVFKKNILSHGMKKKVIPVKADLFPEQFGKFDLIVSNPPYLSLADWFSLPLHIREYEPREALLAGNQGTEILKEIIIRSGKYLRHQGQIILEIGFKQKKTIQNICQHRGFSKITFFNDYNKIPRVVCLQP